MRLKSWRLLLSLGLTLAVAVGAVALARGGKQPASDRTARILTVHTQAAQPTNGYTVRRTFVGRVEAAQRSNLGFEIGGLVTHVTADEGEQVDTGQLLAQLDTARLLARRTELAAQLAEAKAARALAASTLQRTQEALDLNAVSVQQWDEAQQGLRTQQAVVKRVAAQIHTIDVDIRKSKLIAPYSGTIARRHIDTGAVVDPGQSILRLLETGRFEVRVGLSSALAKSVQPGQKHTVHVQGQSIPATVRTLLPDRSATTRTVHVVLTLPSTIDVRDGDLAELSLEQAIAALGFWLPRGALTESARGLWACYVAEPVQPAAAPAQATHQLTRRQLELVYQDEQRVFVRGTLNADDLVVVSGLQRLVPHQHVQVTIGG